MLPQGQEDVCVQRGTPDDDFEYWTASVPRRGAEIWAAKVFWRKTKISRKGIFTIWVLPNAFIFTKMVLTEASIDLIWKYSSLWVILKVFAKKKLILSPKLVKNTTEKGQNQEKPRQGPFYHTNCHWWLSVHQICTQKWFFLQKFNFIILQCFFPIFLNAFWYMLINFWPWDDPLDPLDRFFYFSRFFIYFFYFAHKPIPDSWKSRFGPLNQ